jgi:hypothetical protein
MTTAEKAEAAARMDWHDDPDLCGPGCKDVQPIGEEIEYRGRRYRVAVHVRAGHEEPARFFAELAPVRPR